MITLTFGPNVGIVFPAAVNVVYCSTSTTVVIVVNVVQTQK